MTHLFYLILHLSASFSSLPFCLAHYNTPPSRAQESDEDDDATLIAKANAGDTAAFEALLLRYEKPIFGYLVRLVGTKDDAADLTQDTFVKLYHHLHGADTRKHFRSWLYTIATRTAYDWFRKKKRMRLSSLEETGELPETIEDNDAYTYIEAKERAARLDEALAALHPTHRAVLLLFYKENLSYEEIARTLDAPINTVKTHLHRAKKALRALLIHAHPDSSGTIAHAPARRISLESPRKNSSGNLLSGAQNAAHHHGRYARVRRGNRRMENLDAFH